MPLTLKGHQLLAMISHSTDKWGILNLCSSALQGARSQEEGDSLCRLSIYVYIRTNASARAHTDTHSEEFINGHYKQGGLH